jgi:hypothetical protein
LTDNTNDIQKLIDYSLSFAKTLLAEFKEFYPFAAAVNSDGELIPVTIHEGDEFPSSKDFSKKLELLLEKQLEENKKRTIAITTDVLVKRPDAETSHDAISIKIRQSAEKEYIIYFFEYNLSNENEVEIINSWSEDQI